jgi:hypothetical protein
LIKHFYLLDSRYDNDYKIQALDYEVALWAAVEQYPPTREVISGELTYVAIDQLFSELWYFYT